MLEMIALARWGMLPDVLLCLRCVCWAVLRWLRPTFVLISAPPMPSDKGRS